MNGPGANFMVYVMPLVSMAYLALVYVALPIYLVYCIKSWFQIQRESVALLARAVHALENSALKGH